MVTRISKNIAKINLVGKHVQFALLSDLHWDNPKCDRELLKKHLDYCLEHNIKVMLNGDTFCLMQGKFDPRRSKKDIRPEHNKANYLDVVIEDAVEWFTPYADILTVVGYGNHETGIIRHVETDPLQRFVDLLNYKCNSNVITGGYGGWLILNVFLGETTSKGMSVKVKYYHGSGGGGGIVTRGALNLTRALELAEGFDVFTMGHIHENAARNDVREYLNTQGGNCKIELKQIHMAITGTYKEEYGSGFMGWHVERGAPPKPIGGRILNIYINREQNNGIDNLTKIIDSSKFPL
jgi:hypothetical protein